MMNDVCKKPRKWPILNYLGCKIGKFKSRQPGGQVFSG